MQLKTLVLAALSSLASAQRTWVVTVAQNGSLTYSPEKLTAQPGEYVQFQFHAGNHTVTQSTFDQPCQPISMHTNVTGFHSGYLPAAASASMGMIPTYTIRINSTDPLWIYCAQGKHCGNGMVMVINEPTASNRTLASYKAAAARAQADAPSGTPGGSPGGGAPGGAPGAAPGDDAGAAPGDEADAPGGTDPAETPFPNTNSTTPVETAAAGMLAAPGTFAVLAAAGAALLF